MVLSVQSTLINLTGLLTQYSAMLFGLCSILIKSFLIESGYFFALALALALLFNYFIESVSLLLIS
jgi:hypothetical protein